MKSTTNNPKIGKGVVQLIRLDLTRFLLDLLINFANSLDPDQDRQNVGPDQDPNRLIHLSCF